MTMRVLITGVTGFALILLLSACAALAQSPSHPTTRSSNPPLANLQTSQLAHLQQAAYNYNRYHALAPDDLLGLKRLAEVCTALEEAGVEDPSCREASLRVAEEQRLALSEAEGSRGAFVVNGAT